MALVVCVAALGSNQAKKSEKSDPSDQPVHKEKVVPGAVIVGKIARVDAAKHNIILRFEGVPMMVQQGSYMRPGRGTKHIEYHAIDDVKVRTRTLPTEFDEKGRPRRYTSKELKELRGPDPKLPGYQTEFDSLKNDQYVQLTLVKQKSSKASASKKSKEDNGADEKPKGKKPDKPAKPEVMIIYILAEPIK